MNGYEMFGQVAGLSEASVAYFTHEWPFTSVYSDVVVDVTSFVEHPRTVFTLKVRNLVILNVIIGSLKEVKVCVLDHIEMQWFALNMVRSLQWFRLHTHIHLLGTCDFTEIRIHCSPLIKNA